MLRAVDDVPVIVATARDGDPEIVARSRARVPTTTWSSRSAARNCDARIRAVLRRAGAGEPGDQAVVVGGLRVDPRSREATLDGTELELTPREFDLLYYLAARPGQVVSKRELLQTRCGRHRTAVLTRLSTSICPGCGESWARRRRTRVTCTPSAESASSSVAPPR